MAAPRRGRQAYVGEHGHLCARTAAPRMPPSVDMLMLVGAGRSRPVRVRPAFPLGERRPDALVRALRGGSFRAVSTPTRDLVGPRQACALPRRGPSTSPPAPRPLALRKVLDEGMPLAEARRSRARPRPRAAPPRRPLPPRPRLLPRPRTCGCASWFPVHDAAGKVFRRRADHARTWPGSAPRPPRRPRPEIKRSEERYRSLVQGGAAGGLGGGAGRRDAGRLGRSGDGSPGSPSRSAPAFGWLDVGPPGGPRAGRAGLARVRPERQIFDDRYRIRTKGGSYRHYDVRAVPIERDGKIVEWVGASSDVTSQREAEEMRRQADPSSCLPPRCAPRGCSRRPRCWPRRSRWSRWSRSSPRWAGPRSARCTPRWRCSRRRAAQGGQRRSSQRARTSPGAS